MMTIITRKKRCFLALVIFLLIITIQLLLLAFETDSGNAIPTYDSNHLQLLRDYQARRSKKSDNVLILTPQNEADLKQRTNPKLADNHSNKTILPAQSDDLSLLLSPDEDADPTHTTSLADVFIAVKSTGKFHSTRVQLLLDTWIPLARQSTHLITDVNDVNYTSQFEAGHYHKSSCKSSHFRSGLVCKVSVAYDVFLSKSKRWFCIADDDTYFNVPNLVTLLRKYSHTGDYYIGKPSLNHPIRVTIDGFKQAFWFHTGGAGYCISRGLAIKMSPYAAGGRLRELADRIRMPDDVAVGYIINKILEVDLTRVETFHSHLEGLWHLQPQDLTNQVTLSYGQFQLGVDNKQVMKNVVNTNGVIPTFSPEIDPTRCECQSLVRAISQHQFPVAIPIIVLKKDKPFVPKDYAPYTVTCFHTPRSVRSLEPQGDLLHL